MYYELEREKGNCGLAEILYQNLFGETEENH
jgi:hypothetical protein